MINLAYGVGEVRILKVNPKILKLSIFTISINTPLFGGDVRLQAPTNHNYSF